MRKTFVPSIKVSSSDLRPIEELLEEIKKNGTVIYINPPPSDGRCEGCGRHVSELKPFGGPGDPLVGDFTGELLLKHFRSLCCEDQADPVWDCRDCFLLDDEEYVKKLNARLGY